MSIRKNGSGVGLYLYHKLSNPHFHCSITSTAFIDNKAILDGGGLYIYNASLTGQSGDHFQIRSTHFSRNVATLGNGGGLMVADATLNLFDSIITGNMAHEGGGLNMLNGRVEASNCCFEDNQAVL